MPKKDGTLTKTEAVKEFFIRGRQCALPSGEDGIFLEWTKGRTCAWVLVGGYDGKKRTEPADGLKAANLAEFQE